MTKTVLTLFGMVLAAGLVVPPTLWADVVHLKNGAKLEIEGWRDLGDTIEFASGGGIIRISKAEVQKIDGKPTRGDLVMYTSGVSASSAASLDPAATVKQMTELLQQGDGLFAQAVLSPTEKAGAFRRLGEKWRGFEVPEALRAAHSRGETAIQMAAEAFTAEGEATAPDVKERIEKAKTEVQAALDEVKKAGG